MLFYKTEPNLMTPVYHYPFTDITNIILSRMFFVVFLFNDIMFVDSV